MVVVVVVVLVRQRSGHIIPMNSQSSIVPYDEHPGRFYYLHAGVQDIAMGAARNQPTSQQQTCSIRELGISPVILWCLR